MPISSKNEKILIALSDLSLSSNISQALSKEGYKTIVAKTGQEALEEMKNSNPDLILIDLILPGKNGYDVLSEKSFDRMITKIPVIIVSNNGAPIEMRKIPSTSSVKDYIIKAHVDVKDVLEKVGKVFGYSAEEAAPKNIKDSPSSGKKILWVEDDKFLSNILLKKFESSGYLVSKAGNGDEALQMMQNDTPDIIILDILLPGMSGFDVLQKIHMNEKNKSIPVIMLSNMSKPSDLERAKMLGAQRFLVKAAVSLDQIIKEVASLVR